MTKRNSKTLRTLLAIAGAGALALPLAGCEGDAEDAAEETGEAIEEGVEETGDALEDATD